MEGSSGGGEDGFGWMDGRIEGVKTPLLISWIPHIQPIPYPLPYPTFTPLYITFLPSRFPTPYDR